MALDVARALGLRLYPLGTYPLPVEPAIREGELDYDIQVKTVGPERFVHAGRCAGAHLHLELPPGTVGANTGLSPTASAAARSEALGMHNLATALDPALVALTRSCPFYEGRASGMAERTVRYRGSEGFGWEGVYAGLPEVGALLPYAEDADALVGQQFRRYEAWLEAVEEAGLERRLFSKAGGDLLRPAWNPVRLNRQGTVELRSMDSNLPEVTLTAAALVLAAADRVRREGLTVTPDAEVRAFEVDGERLLVPGFAYLGGDLLRAAVTGGVEGPDVVLYLDSVFGFAAGGDDGLLWPRRKRDSGHYTTEAEIRREHGPAVAGGRISEEEGLRLVREACAELEAQVSRLRRGSGEGAAVGAT